MSRMLILFCLILSTFLEYKAQTLTNKGAYINAQSGAFIRVNGTVQNDNSGIITVNGNGTPSSAELYVSQDVINNATINADGYIRLLGNWIDNNTFSSTLGTVFMEGANQQLGGTAATVFYNLTLDGSGIKTQTINKFANGVLDLKGLQLNTDVYGFYVNNTSTSAIIRTTGFVSSANGGFLSRKTLSNALYLFPVGSTANTSANIPGTGSSRYRPVQITPNDALANTYTVRMANVNATTETYNLTLTDVGFCALNPLFFHQINRSVGTSSADVTVNFDAAADGNWEGLARWNITTPNLWQKITGSTVTAGSPFSTATKLAWNNFSVTPYILFNNKPVANVTCSDVCANQTAPVTASVSPTGTYSYSWTTPITFSPNPGNVSTFNSGIGGNYCVTVTNTVNNCVSDPFCCSFVTNQPPSINAISPP